MTRAYLAFTDTGLALARRLADALPGSVDRCGSGGVSLAGWTALQFAQSDALVFVGAVGIAVRAIAPHCRSKASDPAVVVLDECGRFAVPVLSGHLGGANDLARALAAVCGAVPVITTATDAHGIFAVDEWAKHQNCMVLEAERIKHVSSKLLAGQSVRFAAEFPVQGTPPAGVASARTPAEADFALTLSPAGDALHLVPHIGVLGIGCRRGTCAEQLEAAFADFCARHSLAPACIVAAASIDLKADEAGLLAFCRAHGWPITFYSAEQLRALSGPFTPSPFVQSVTGVDNVCERAAVLAQVAAVEDRSEHPIARAIVDAAKAEGLRIPAVQAFESVTGFGVRAEVDGAKVEIGADRFMRELGLNVDDFAAESGRLGDEGKTPLYAAIDGKLAAMIAVADPIKDTTQPAIDALHALGLKVVMITGDNRRTGEAIAKLLGIDEVVAEVLPGGKVDAVQRLKKEYGTLAYVGDGINDAPALAEADVGIAIGTGTDIAIEAADVVLMSGDLGGVPNAIALSKATMANIGQNLFWAFAYNVALIPVAAGLLYPFNGTLLSPVFAAGAMALSSVFVLSNALRLKRFRAPL